MKNIFVYQYKFDSPVEQPNSWNLVQTYLKAQIENSLRFWTKEDILLVTNFEFSYKNVTNIKFDFNNCTLMLSKAHALKFLIQNKHINDTEIWLHDLDSFQDYSMTFPVKNISGLVPHEKKNMKGQAHAPFHGGSQFHRIPECIDFIEKIIEASQVPLYSEECCIGNYYSKTQEIEMLDARYSITMKLFNEKLEYTTPPFVALHIKPHRKEYWDFFCTTNNPLKKRLISDQLLELILKYFPNKTTSNKEMIFILGSGKCNLKTCENMILQQNPNIKQSNIKPEEWALCDFRHYYSQLLNNLYLMKTDSNIVINCGHFFICYVESILYKYPNSKFICIKGDKKNTIKKFLKDKTNYWENENISENYAKLFFPKYSDSIEIAAEKYWNHYYEIATQLEKNNPNFKIFNEQDVFDHPEIICKFIKTPFVNKQFIEKEDQFFCKTTTHFNCNVFSKIENHKIYSKITVQNGEFLYYLFGKKWNEIYDLNINKDFREKNPNPNLIKPNSYIYIPIEYHGMTAPFGFRIDMEKASSQRGIYIECGAGKGNQLVAVRNALKEFQFYAFEANPFLIEELRNATKPFDNIQIINCAVWSKNGNTTLFPGRGRSELGSTLLKGKLTGQVDYEKGVQVQSINFGEWIIKKFKPNEYIVIHCNIEGSEYEIINSLYENNALEYINELLNYILINSTMIWTI